MRGFAGVFAVLALGLVLWGGSAERALAVYGDNATPTCRSIPVPSASAMTLSRAERAASGRLVPIWAMVEGGAPVAGGRVQLFSGTGSKRHRVPLAAPGNRTNSQGTVILRARRIPKELTVVVRGGTVDGKRFPGALKMRASRYHARDILTVNPVTTIIAAYRGDHPRMGAAKATKRVKRYLRIPGFHDVAVDLRRSDRYFDGDVLLRRLGKVRMGELAKRIVTSMNRSGRHGSEAFVKRPSRAARARTAKRTRLGLSDEEGAGSAFIAKNLISGIVSAAGGQIENAALGFVLSNFGLGGDPTASALAAIQTQLNQISKQLADLEVSVSAIEAQLSQDEYETLVSGADSDQSLIDGAENCLSYLLTLTPGDPDLKILSTGLTAYIKDKLLTIGDDLHTRLTGSGGLVQASYQATLAEARNEADPSYPFWTQADGDVPRQVLDFYAGYQAELAMFVAEYDHVQQLDAATVTANVQSYGDDIDNEMSQLKARVPDYTVVDTNTGQVWSQDPSLDCIDLEFQVFPWQATQNGQVIENDLPCGRTQPLSNFTFFTTGPQQGQDANGNTVTLDHYAPPYDLYYDGRNGGGVVAPYVLRAASENDLEGLIQDWTKPGGGSSPADFLSRHGGFDMSQPWVWLQTGNQPVCGRALGDFVCFGLDLSSADANNNLRWLDDDPNERQAAIMWVADAKMGDFWF
jgi:hypothetical protein